MPKQRFVPPNALPIPIIAQDPSIRVGGKVLLGEVEIPCEVTAPGPRGARVYVVDYDASNRRLYRPARMPALDSPRAIATHGRRLADPRALARDPALHAVNAYATAMAVLGRFERALGRRIGWGFGGHQIYLVPHAFEEANAYYSENDHALLFGYLRDKKKTVFSCLSHDAVAHEVGHALLDGLRDRYTYFSSPDQAAFHEAFADLVAIFSVFTMVPVVQRLLGRTWHRPVAARELDREWLKRTPLTSMAEELGQATSVAPRRGALRVALRLPPSPTYYRDMEAFGECHARAEILVAAVLHAFLAMWKHALFGAGARPRQTVPVDVVASEGAALAERVLMMVIRAIDYAPVQDLQFSDFLSALCTADREVYPGDEKYRARQCFTEAFASFGIPAGRRGLYWETPDAPLSYDHVHPSALRHDPTEVFRFLWQNRRLLGLYEPAYTRVTSVRPCIRRGSDGFLVNETVCEYVQSLRLTGRELGRVRLESGKRGRRAKLEPPPGLGKDDEVTLRGGGVLLFDEAGRLKYHVQNRILSPSQSERLAWLAAAGQLGSGAGPEHVFARLHLAAGTRWARSPAVRKGL